MSAGAIAGGSARVEDLPAILPVFPLDGALLLPRGGLPLNIFEPRYLNMVDDAMAGDRSIGMIATQSGGDRARPALAPLGCLGRITSFSETADGRYLITLTGVCRFAVVEELPVTTPYRQVRADYSAFGEDLEPAPFDLEFGRDRLLEALRAYLDRRGLEIEWDTARGAPAEALINSLSMALPFASAEKQALLAAADLVERETALVALLEIEAAGFDDEDDGPQTLQ
ncbi:MAG: LON peptidase substrate-binding domain-containing protein [Proteobacteria bacterium]|nr:LON peptidase substrate-binding domain-containing protein [Pseudomonadota bacterium]MBW3616797.1 LON peptidase substrate-binding domain-containing protein [Pseudomonadota bacterium]